MPMFSRINFMPEPYLNGSPPIYESRLGYRRISVEKFKDRPAALRPRQANFYRNLIGLALVLKSERIPVDFESADGKRMCLDRGCIKIAEHAGFIRPLENDGEDGTVATVMLSWRVRLE